MSFSQENPRLLVLFHLSILLLFLLPSCGGRAEREGVTPTRAEAQTHMNTHFERAGEVRDALVRGQLDRVRSGAEWIATHQEPATPPAGSATTMKSFAHQVSRAQTLEEAAHATAQMGRSCGECHQAQKVSPRFLVGTVPPQGSGLQAEMARHVWAAERMWEGLIGPEDYSWRSGAEALEVGWLGPGDVVADPGDRDKVRELCQRLYALGARASAAKGMEERAEIYGEFLTTCIDCHQLTAAIIR